MKKLLFKLLFGDEYLKIQQLESDLETARQNNATRRERRVARFALEATVSEAEVARRLAGTIKTPVVEAVMSLIDHKIIEMSDRATNPPTTANTPDLRTYEAGGANAIAELKARLQDLAAPQEETKPAT